MHIMHIQNPTRIHNRHRYARPLNMLACRPLELNVESDGYRLTLSLLDCSNGLGDGDGLGDGLGLGYGVVLGDVEGLGLGLGHVEGEGL